MQYSKKGGKALRKFVLIYHKTLEAISFIIFLYRNGMKTWMCSIDVFRDMQDVVLEALVCKFVLCTSATRTQTNPASDHTGIQTLFTILHNRLETLTSCPFEQLISVPKE